MRLKVASNPTLPKGQKTIIAKGTTDPRVESIFPKSLF